MGMSMGMDFENPMGMGMEMTFENGYECGYSYTRPESTPRPSLGLTFFFLKLIFPTSREEWSL